MDLQYCLPSEAQNLSPKESITELPILYVWVSALSMVVGMTTLPPLCVNCLEIWDPQPPGTLRACPRLYRDYNYKGYY